MSGKGRVKKERGPPNISLLSLKFFCVFSMRLEVKKVSSTLLLLLLLFVATSNAYPSRDCGDNRFFDRVARICTNCDDICNPLRGTQYLCDQYADECRPREYRNLLITRLNMKLI